MRITVLGASGFVGRNLVRHLLMTTDHTVVAFCRSAETTDFGEIPTVAMQRLERRPSSILNQNDVRHALEGADAAYYLIHMMGTPDGDFYEMEARAASVAAEAAALVKLPRLIMLGGLGRDSENLSKHLASRHNSAEILRQNRNFVIELRASMVVGSGSVAYDVIRAIAVKLPVLAIPRWAITKTQPITLHDLLAYLTTSLTLKTKTSQIIEIGGPAAMTYKDLVKLYAKKIGRQQIVITVPAVPRWAAKLWLKHYLPPKDANIAGPMVDSLHNEMVVTDHSAIKLFPAIHPQPIELAFFKD